MSSQRLYYQDSHLREFTARVLSCVPGKHGYDVVLDRTAFYPEGGGQPGDRGMLGGVAVTDTHELAGEVVHYCDAPLEVGSEVTGQLDWDYRFDLMQHHSGEHILSGLIHARFGYDNVGFHMGREVITIDLSGPITDEELRELEAATNEIIWQNRPVRCFWPEPQELAALPYRSKKTLTGSVRLVEIPGADLCACCGVHVERTGEIGLIKLLSAVKFHDGIRMELLCGRRAMAYLSGVWEQNRRVSGLLSAKPMETADAAQRLCKELGDARYRLTQAQERLFALQAEGCRGQGDVVLFEENLGSDGVRRLCDAVLQICGGTAAVFSRIEGGYQYALGTLDGDLRPLTKALNTRCNGRGGGKPNFTQGSVAAAREEIEAVLREK